VTARVTTLDVALAGTNTCRGSADRAYITARDLCSRWDCSHATLYRWIQGGYVPRPVRFGPRAVRWATKDIEDFEQRLARDSGTQGYGPSAARRR
jgi:predicted DNA-binding transcriptional regulator AlpA